MYAPPLRVEPFIEDRPPFLLSMLTGSLESFRHILAFEEQSSKLMNVFGMDWILPIQPENSIVQPVDQEFCAP
jgi:hypothetical protein